MGEIKSTQSQPWRRSKNFALWKINHDSRRSRKTLRSARDSQHCTTERVDLDIISMLYAHAHEFQHEACNNVSLFRKLSKILTIQKPLALNIKHTDWLFAKQQSPITNPSTTSTMSASPPKSTRNSPQSTRLSKHLAINLATLGRATKTRFTKTEKESIAGSMETKPSNCAIKSTSLWRIRWHSSLNRPRRFRAWTDGRPTVNNLRCHQNTSSHQRDRKTFDVTIYFLDLKKEHHWSRRSGFVVIVIIDIAHSSGPIHV